MHLTAQQRALLGLYKRLHGTSPTMSRLLVISMRAFLVPVLVSIVGVAFIMALNVQKPTESMLFVGFFIGLGVGCTSFLLGNLRRTVRLWPVVEQVLDWQKIDELLAETSPLFQEHHDANPYSN